MEDEQLIECVRNYELIYNLHHPKYMDNAKKDIAWKHIAEQMKTPATVCKQKWQCLRDSYRRSLNKRRLTGGRKMKRWKYEDEMSFLAPYFVSRKSLNSVEQTSDDEDPENDPFQIYPELLLNNSENCESSSDITGAASDNVKEDIKEELLDIKPKINVIGVQTEQPASATLLTPLLQEQSNHPSPREHELDRFFLSLSDTVKKFPLYQQALAKSKLFSIVSEMELQQLAPPTTMSSFQSSNLPSPQSTSNSVPPSATYM